MNKLLLAIAAAAFAAGTANAQRLVPQQHQGIQKQLRLAPVNGQASAFQNLKASHAEGTSTSLMLNKFTTRADVQRDPKVLSYLNPRESYDNNQLGLAQFGLSYSAIEGYRIGFAAYYPQEIVKKYVGNKITNIIFVPYISLFSNCQVFVMNPNTGEVLYTKDCAKDFTGGAPNGVSMDFTIPDNTPLMVGYSAILSQNPEDENAATYGVLTPTLPDPTYAGAGAYLLADVNDGKGMQMVTSFSQPGDGSVDAAPIWVETSGENGLKSLDAYMEGSNPARDKGVNANTLHAISLMNMGVTPITGVNYSVTLRDKVDGHNVRTITGERKFDEPLDFFNGYQFYVNSVMPDTPTWGVDSVSITAVNGKADEDMTDNSAMYIVYSLGNSPAKRRALVENYTSSAAGYAPTGLVGMEAVANQYDMNSDAEVNDVNIVNIHIGTDPLTDVSYNPAVDLYQPSVPVAYINRVGRTDPYSGKYDDATSAKDGIVRTLADYLEQNAYCEASVGVGSEYDENTEKVNVTGRVSFSFDVEAGDYSLGYIITENQLTGTQANSYTGTSGLPSDLSFLAKNKSTYSANYDYVSRYTSNPQGIVQHDDNKLYYYDAEGAQVPALKAHTVYTDVKSIPMPDGVNVDASNVVIVVYDNKTREVVNSASAWMGYTTTGIEKNTTPASEAMVTVANGAFNVTAQNATAEVYGVDGKLVSSCTVNGTASLPTFGHGIYVLRVVQDGKAYTKKAAF